MGGAPFRPADNKIIQRQLNLGPCLEKSPSIPIPFHPYLSFPFSAPHCCVINSQAPAGKSTFPLARSVAGTKHVLITNHNQERSTQVCQLYNVSDVPPVSSETLFSLCSGCTQHFKEVLKCIFASVAMVLCPTSHRFIPWTWHVHSPKYGLVGGDDNFNTDTKDFEPSAREHVAEWIITPIMSHTYKNHVTLWYAVHILVVLHIHFIRSNYNNIKSLS